MLRIAKGCACRISVMLIIFCIMCGNGIFSCKAENYYDSFENTTPFYDGKEEFGSFIEDLPDEIQDILPDDILEAVDSPEKALEIFGPEYIIDISSGLFKNALSSALKTFAFIASISLIMTLLSSVGSAFCSENSGIRVWNLAGTLCIGYCTYSLVWSHIESVLTFSKNISTFIKSLAVVMGGIYLSAGETGSAGVHSVWVFSITSFTEELCGNILLPIMQISFAATLSSGVISGTNISRLVQMIRNAFASLLVFFMTVISVILSFQTIIAHSSDTVAMRSIKYAISHSVPIIGGLVSDSARTLSTGLTLMKNSVGFIGIVIIILISLYPLISLTVSKYSLQLASSFSAVIYEDKANLFLDESVRMLSFLIAIVIMLDVAFIFCISLFAVMPAAAS